MAVMKAVTMVVRTVDRSVYSLVAMWVEMKVAAKVEQMVALSADLKDLH